MRINIVGGGKCGAHHMKMSGSDSEQELVSPENELAEELFEERKGATIYPVPPDILECDRKAYVPKVVCIGPFFNPLRARRLAPMQYYKEKCMKKLISEHHLPVQEARNKIIDLYDEVVKKYSVRFPELDREKFSDILMLDGCFLLHLLLRHADVDNVKVDEDDGKITYGRSGLWQLVRYDLLLLQNQIPFIVIQTLNQLLPDDKKKNLVDCAINLYRNFHPCRNPKKSRFYIQVDKVHHLLHLIYLSLLPCPQRCKSFPKQKLSPPWIPSATELQLAGVKFAKREKAGGFLSFLDVQFSDGVMEIPRLKVRDYSISLFRNLIAWEQCVPGTKYPVTAYAVFMNLLINTEEDTRLLHLEDILINSLTVKGEKKDATHFFSRLCNEVHKEESHLDKLFSDVKEYHDSTWRKWRAELYRTYFRSPLTILSLIGAFLFLVFSGTQFILNIVSR